MALTEVIKDAGQEIIGRTPKESMVFGSVILALSYPAYFEPADTKHLISYAMIGTGSALFTRGLFVIGYPKKVTVNKIESENDTEISTLD